MKARFSCLLAIVVLAALAVQAQANDRVVPPDQSYGGSTYGQWHVKWWQWADGMTNAQSPVVQKGGVVDTSNQPAGPVWFLAGYFGDWFNPQDPVKFTRTITVPKEKALFFPILNGELTPAEYNQYSAKEISEGRVPLSQWDYLQSWMDPSLVDAMSASIDGVALTNLGIYRAPSSQQGYNTWLPPADNHMPDYYPTGGDAFPTMCDGWCLLVEPLPVGPHTIAFKASFGENLGMDITYEVNVVPEPSALCLFALGGLLLRRRRA